MLLLDVKRVLDPERMVGHMLDPVTQSDPTFISDRVVGLAVAPLIMYHSLTQEINCCANCTPFLSKIYADRIALFSPKMCSKCISPRH